MGWINVPDNIDVNELYHHGILGQKWGIRRFQNKDGSLTSAGKKRYKAESESSTETDEERRQRIIKSGNQKEVLKAANELSNAELKEAIERIKLNEELKNVSFNKFQNGQKKVDSVMHTVTSTTQAATSIYNVARAFNSNLPSLDPLKDLQYSTQKANYDKAMKDLEMKELEKSLKQADLTLKLDQLEKNKREKKG